MECSLAIKNEWIVDIHNSMDNLKSIILSDRNKIWKYVLYDFIFVKF